MWITLFIKAFLYSGNQLLCCGCPYNFYDRIIINKVVNYQKFDFYFEICEFLKYTDLYTMNCC
jgi:hypothetical protein